MLERLQKILSARGIASRRKAEEYITQGLVKVNGKTASLGEKADPLRDTIEVDGKVLSERQEMLYFAMHKPVGVETSNVTKKDQMPKAKCQTKVQAPSTKFQEKTVRDLLPEDLKGKIFPVGRLDKDSSGLLLFTNDGVLAYRLTHPKFDHEKEYEVTVDRSIPAMSLKHIERGIILKGKQTKPAKIMRISPTTFRLVLTEGRNRQIRRMCQDLGYTVKELKRVRIMTLEDATLGSGKVRSLTAQERATLLHSVGLA